MMNMLDTQDKLKNFSEQQLVGQMQSPTGDVPQFLVLGEIERRKRMRDDAQRQQGMNQTTVAQDAVTAAGVPQGGITDIAQALAPKTDMAQNTGIMSVAPQAEAPQMMAGGGVVKMYDGMSVDGYSDPMGGFYGADTTYVPEDPTTGSFLNDLILSDAAKQQILDTQAKVAASNALATPAVQPELPAPPPVVPGLPSVNPDIVGNVKTGGTGGVGKGAASSYEQMLMDTLANREKAQKQDKWLALAQVGLGMMSSQNPSFFGAAGEAGLKGVESFRQSRDQYDTDRMKILGDLEQYKMAKAAAQAKASGGGGGGGKPPSASFLTALMKDKEGIAAQLAALGPIPEPGWFGPSEDPAAPERIRLANQLKQVNDAIGSVYLLNGVPYLGGADVGDEIVDLSDPLE